MTLSFHAVKHITTGEGGAVLTNNKKIVDEINILKTHGVYRKKNQSQIWKYEMIKLGFNYRITDFQCALGISQLKKLNKFLKKRKKIAKIYDRHFQQCSNIEIPKINRKVGHAYHLYPLKINFKKFKISKENFFRKLRAKKISLQVHYIPIYNQPFYKKLLHLKKNQFPVAERFYEEEVSLPIYFSLTLPAQLKVISSIKNILGLR